MADPAIPRSIRRIVRDRARNRCEYCRHSADFSSAPFVCDHVLPRIQGAGNSPDELAWCCPYCNGHKYSKTHARDPKTKRKATLFHPRRQKWADHFAWSDDFLQIIGLTQTGRATVEALRLNRPELIKLRGALLLISEHPPEAF